MMRFLAVLAFAFASIFVIARTDEVNADDCIVTQVEASRTEDDKGGCVKGVPKPRRWA